MTASGRAGWHAGIVALPGPGGALQGEQEERDTGDRESRTMMVKVFAETCLWPLGLSRCG